MLCNILIIYHIHTTNTNYYILAIYIEYTYYMLGNIVIITPINISWVLKVYFQFMPCSLLRTCVLPNNKLWNCVTISFNNDRLKFIDKWTLQHFLVTTTPKFAIVGILLPKIGIRNSFFQCYFYFLDFSNIQKLLPKVEIGNNFLLCCYCFWI